MLKSYNAKINPFQFQTNIPMVTSLKYYSNYKVFCDIERSKLKMISHHSR